MTTISKVLVVVILALTLTCMAFATTVYVAQHDWPQEYDKLKKDHSSKTSQLSQVTSQLQQTEQSLNQTTTEREQKETALNADIDALSEERDELRERESRALAQAKSAQESAGQAITEAVSRRDEIESLRVKWMTMIEERDQAIANRIESQDQLIVVQDQHGVATRRNQELVTRVGQLENVLVSYGLDPNQTIELAAPPPVEGVIRETSETTGLAVISIGSDDGLLPGHRLEVYRLGKLAENSKYLGRVEVREVDPDQSIVKILRPAQGKIRSGDHVASRLQ